MVFDNSSKVSEKQGGVCVFSVGGIVIQVTADLPMNGSSFHPIIQKFSITAPGPNPLTIHHHFYLPEPIREPARLYYDRQPWRVYRQDHNWIYEHLAPSPALPILQVMAKFNIDHTQCVVFSPSRTGFEAGSLNTITLLSSDLLLLARVLADRQGCVFHSAGIVIDGQGFLFAGHSGAGKSTIVTQLMPHGEILCDDRMIIRRWPEGFRIHGTWSHGTVPVVSPGSAPLRAIFLLEQANENRLEPVEDRKELARLFPFLVIKPLVTADWWEKTFDLLEILIREIPVYRLRFDMSGRVIDTLRAFL